MTLSAVLDNARNQSVGSDVGLAPDQRRDLWRFRDYMTRQGVGRDIIRFITPDQETRQNTVFAPADASGQVDIVQSIANWQMGAIATRVQQIRTAARDQNPSHVFALARRLEDRRNDSEPRNLRESLRMPVALGDSRSEPRDVNVTDLAHLLQEGVNAGGGALGVKGLGVFLSGRSIHILADTSNRERGSKTDGGGFTAGVDYRVAPNAVMGVAFGYNHYETDFSQDAGDSELDDFTGMVFGSLFLGDTFYLDGTIRGSYLQTETTRKPPNLFTASIFADQDSDPDGWTMSADIGEAPRFQWARSC